MCTFVVVEVAGSEVPSLTASNAGYRDVDLARIHSRIGRRQPRLNVAIATSTACLLTFHHKQYHIRHFIFIATMALVDYSDSDSEASDTEVKPTPKPAPLNKKSAFQKLVDSSTGKLQVSLPTPAATDDGDSRPAKRTKIGAGAFSGFNSFLPPPKKTGGAGLSLPAPKAANGSGSANERLGQSPKRASITLKGAGPAFSRSRGDEYDEEGNYDDMGAPITSNGGGMGMSLPPPKAAPQPVAQGKPAEEVKMIGLGKPMQFKPLSVGRKVVKKKKKTVDELRPAEVEKPKAQQAQVVGQQPPAPSKPKSSLFSVPGDDEDDEPVAASRSGKYEPMIYGAHTDRGEENGATNEASPYMDTYDPSSYTSAHQTSYTQNQVPAPPTGATSSLSDIASDLHLSASERRQLFGRNHSQRQAANIKNFNMDAEYRHNEEVRASGETVTHNPVRAIAPGKHSLQQLVSQVQNQKEALEESFQKGYANRREASSRYGW